MIPGTNFRILKSSYQYRNSHYLDMMVCWLSYLCNGTPYSFKIALILEQSSVHLLGSPYFVALFAFLHIFHFCLIFNITLANRFVDCQHMSSWGQDTLLPSCRPMGIRCHRVFAWGLRNHWQLSTVSFNVLVWINPLCSTILVILAIDTILNNEWTWNCFFKNASQCYNFCNVPWSSIWLIFVIVSLTVSHHWFLLCLSPVYEVSLTWINDD